METAESCFSTLKFPILPPMLSPEHPSGTATPPLQALASVPFKWEEQPGKPRPCTDIILRPEPAKCLELPPCKIAKMPSPTTVLDGPYIVGRSKFASFRLFREPQASSESSSSGGCSPPAASVDILLIAKKKKGWLFGKSLRRKSGDEGTFGVSHSSPSAETCSGVKMEGKMRRNGSFSSLSQAASAHLWVTVRQSLKNAVPWKSKRKSKKEGAESDI